MNKPEQQAKFEAWCIVVIMGPQRLAGLVSECTLAGAGIITCPTN